MSFICIRQSIQKQWLRDFCMIRFIDREWVARPSQHTQINLRLLLSALFTSHSYQLSIYKLASALGYFAGSYQSFAPGYQQIPHGVVVADSLSRWQACQRPGTSAYDWERRSRLLRMNDDPSCQHSGNPVICRDVIRVRNSMTSSGAVSD